MDIETIIQNNKIIPYLICAYNGQSYIESFGLNQLELFTNFINGLLTFFSKKTKTLTVFAHNLSGFDGIFLLNHLIQFGTVEPLLHNGKLITIKVILNIEGYYGKTIIFKDSLLLLPIGLRKLALIFKTTQIKGVFPYKLYNILYKGVFPKFEYFTDLSLSNYISLYLEFRDQIWDFKNESIKYCKLDCLILYEILTQFNELVFNEFSINIDKVLTLPALSMRIFKTLFMKVNSIYQLHGKVEQNIRESYSGGAVDVYIPHNKVGTYSISNTFRPLYVYDVNSLYPFVMSTKPMPIGKPTAFEGNILKFDPNAYGFFYCKITSPTFLEHPILQRVIKTSEGTRTIAGLGSWTGWISSVEMDNAIRYGYSFEILKGYQFETGDIFSNFVNTLYNLRMEFDKSHPMNHIAKLMLNSLYGKFGMRNEFTRVDVYSIHTEADKVAFKDLLKIWGTTVKDFVLLDNHLIVVRDSILDLRKNPDQEIDPYHGVETNIAIAAAVTANARIHMSYIKNNPKFRLYYSDTDNMVVDQPLPAELVGESLGQLKLEHVIEKAVFIAPKVYALILEDGTEVIKIKGLTKDVISNLHFSDLETLLIQDSTREFSQEFKNGLNNLLYLI